ncbi:hypothetical protein ALC53_06990 [Atta colombica]|uniref:Uncharacterized protein n=1 Tax=Atta colombica TaxID=520822 RepID=A0A195BEA8_9HYME|nr:hypothetical protein ALC53_06990 [Atta colombica]
MCPSRRGVQCIIARADATADVEAGVARSDGIPLALCRVYDDEEGSELRWFPRRANFSVESADRASPLIYGAGKLEILGMFPPRTEAPTADKLTFCYAPHVDMATVIEVEDRLTGHGGISSLGGGNSSPYSGAHHHGHRGNGNGGGMPHHGGASLPTASDFQPPYFPPPFPSHHHAPASPQHPGLGQPQHLDYLVGDPYTQTLNTLHQHHYNHLSAAVTAGQRSGDLRRDAEGIHVVSTKICFHVENASRIS